MRRPLSLRLHTGQEAYHLGMSRIHPESPGSDPSDHSVAAEVRVREAPEEEEDDEDEEDEGSVTDHEGDDDEEDDGGYSVQVCRLCQW